MGVTVRRRKGKTGWWLFVNNDGRWLARNLGELPGGKRAALRLATQIAAKLGSSRAPRRKATVTYFLLNREGTMVKIGRTLNLAKRVADLEAAAGVRLTLLGTLQGDHKNLWHRRFAADRTLGEWFTLSSELELALREAFGATQAQPSA